ncbi:acyl-CoA dehydrogenase family protein [Hydrogenophaga sp. BPS33]|uniref:acyl-CoA dehydrogenase family protein n=1 Tax=Hydrogenophaga sp. BPS33 TaxID=2651974 RepID=UPI00131F4FC5|nr:acyl-CoA dehydrogenase family protein [Hydrogenophaga sp. BPS33]QHE83942.1 acyl-CoA dehydrogenase [Hydrogenophaga sp. BPS33]
MTDFNSLSDEAFRTLARDFLEQHYPEDKRHIIGRARWADIQGWYRTLSQAGWLAMAWPREHGGRGLAAGKQLIWIEEQERHGAARVPDHGINMIGPTLIRLGTDAQRAHYLPRILDGQHLWAQGYSEPEAGSDLASLRTEAVVDGDELVINGQKTWSTMAQESTHMYMLVRTDKTAPKRQGISFVLVDLSTPGIRVRPIQDIVGESNFCEVFFDGVRVPLANVVGGLHQGWSVAKTQLGFERLLHGSPRTPENLLMRVQALCERAGLLADAVIADRLARLDMDVADLAALYARFADVVRRGEALPASVSILKIWSSETYGRIAELAIDVLGSCGALAGTPEFEGERVELMVHYYRARPITVFAGSNEIQRNILAKDVLGLPAR